MSENQNDSAPQDQLDQDKTPKINSPKSMKPLDWFGVGVRLLGVWMLLQMVDELVFFANAQLENIKLSNYTPATYLIHAVVDLLVGLFLLFGAKNLVRIVDDWEKLRPGFCSNCGDDLRISPTQPPLQRCPRCGGTPIKP